MSQQVCNRVVFCPPSWFLLVNDFVMKKSSGDQGHGIDLSDRGISELDFTDIIALMANDHVTLQKVTSLLEDIAN